MYLQGAIFKGKYGQVSPQDYAGLKFWYRASDGISTVRGNYISKWADKSGNGNDLFPLIGAYAYSVGNTNWGLGVYGTTGSNSMVLASSKASASDFLMDGSPSTIIHVFRGAIATNTGPSVTMQLNNPSYSYGINNAGVLAFRSRNSAGGINATSQNLTLFASSNKNYFLDVVNYGFSSASPQISFGLNETVVATSAYNANGVSPLGSAGFGFGAGALSGYYTYEIIIYNNTGKTKNQIDGELANLITNYLKPTYPNFY